MSRPCINEATRGSTGRFSVSDDLRFYLAYNLHMIYFLWFVLIALIVSTTTSLALILNETWRITIRRGVPAVSSSWPVVDKVIKAQVFPREGLILDLGCGTGWALRRIWRAGYNGPFIGYETALLPYLVGRSWNWITRAPVKIVRQDFSAAPFEKAKGIYLFLLPRMLPEVGKMIATKSRVGTVVVSAEFAIPGWEAEKVLEARGVTARQAKIHVYRVKAQES